MVLKSGIRLPDFFQAVHSCHGEVLFQTPDGDRLNLKSTLSQFVFAAAYAGELQTLDGTLECSEEDGLILMPFLQN